MNIVMEWVKSGLLFTIIASVIMMLCPNKSYIKHISLVIGLLFILVMIHPVMEFMELDSTTYISYIENFLLLEGTQEKFSDQHLAMYEEAVALQLTAAFNEWGYDVKKTLVKVQDDGSVCEVRVSLINEVKDLEEIEQYLYDLFGKEVRIVYESG